MTTTHRETKTLPFTPEQLFNLVADVQHYPQFLPWCRAVRIYNQTDHEFTADMLVGFRAVKESYTTLVKLDPYHSVSTHLVKGPFHHLESKWLFKPAPEGTEVHFHITFTFRYKWLSKLIGSLFDEAFLKILDAFERRAYALYGEPKL